MTDSAGNDYLYFAGSTNGVTVNLGLTTSQVVNGNLTLTLASATSIEHIYGGSGNDILIGNGLNNTLNGYEGDDVLSGGDGNDTLNGGAGNDKLYGGAGADTLDGGDGNDTLYGESGNDTLVGGAGNDFYVFNTNTPLGSDTVTDSAGNDYLYFVGSTNNVTVNISLTTPQVVNANLTLTLASATSIEHIYGGSGNDTLIGNTLNNTLNGYDGDDVLSGGDGNDTLNGGVGNNTLNGGAGNDTLVGGAGNETYVFRLKYAAALRHGYRQCRQRLPVICWQHEQCDCESGPDDFAGGQHRSDADPGLSHIHRTYLWRVRERPR